MLVKINSRGSGGGSGPTGYLMSNKDHAGKERAVEPKVLRGFLQETRDLIDSLEFKRKYTSGTLSFSEPDIASDRKQVIIDGFEQCLFPSLDKDQYSVLWVEHRDKDRLELNFVIPNVELLTGKRLQPYYHRADLHRVDAWQTLANDAYELTDPHDPSRSRSFVAPSDLPKTRIEAIQAITDSLVDLNVKNRSDVILELQAAGFEITRQTKKSISIKNPESSKPIRLSGGVYAESFRQDSELEKQGGSAARRFEEGRELRINEARIRYQRGVEKRKDYLQKRYRKSKQEEQSLDQITRDSSDRRLTFSLNIDSVKDTKIQQRPTLQQDEPTPNFAAIFRNPTPRGMAQLHRMARGQDEETANLQSEVSENDRVRDNTFDRVRGIRQRAQVSKLKHNSAATADRRSSEIIGRAAKITRYTEQVSNRVHQRTREIKQVKRQSRDFGRDFSR